MKYKYLMSNEELQDAIIQTNAMVKAYGEKIPDALMAHYCELLKTQQRRTELARIEDEKD